MRINLFLIIGISCLFSLNAYAYYCSTGQANGFINTGDSMQQVQQACGTPTNVTQPEQPSSIPTDIQQWTYSHQPSHISTWSAGSLAVTAMSAAPPSYQPPAATNVTYPPDVTFVVINGKVQSIISEGQQLSSSNLCASGATVQVGQDAQSVLTSCGQPAQITKTQKDIPTQPQTITTWTYDQGDYRPPLILQFTNGQLTQVTGN